MAMPASGHRRISPAQAAAIRLLVLDIDGVMTDGHLHFDAEGRESKVFHVRDGYGIKQAQRCGVEFAVISGRRSKAAEVRIRDLGIAHMCFGRDDKLTAFQELNAGLGIPMTEVACMGDDVPDLELMQAAGVAIAVADAHPRVLAAADWQTSLRGGKGAVREVCDFIVAARREHAANRSGSA